MIRPRPNALLCTLALAALCAGCFGPRTPPAPKYTVGHAAAEPDLADLRVNVRMAPDLRAATTPLHFQANGTVTPIPGLAYYAPLELAIEAYLRALAQSNGQTPQRPFPVVVTCFGIDARSGSACVRVCLEQEAKGGLFRSAEASLPLTEPATPETLRSQLEACLRESFLSLVRSSR